MPNFAAPIPPGLTATGGVISDYISGPAVYRAHVFTSSGTFTVTAPGGYGDTVDYLVVAGGGGGGYQDVGGGGGAGGLRTSTAFPVSPGPYSVTIGSGGSRGASNLGGNGTPSVFSSITSYGGGGAGSGNGGSPGTGQNGGSAGEIGRAHV